MENKNEKPKIELKPTDWATKVKVWECLVRNPRNKSAIRRELEFHAGEEGYPAHPPDKATIKKICEDLGTLPPELVSKLPTEVQAYAQKLNPLLRADLGRLKGVSQPATIAEQEPCEETPYNGKTREEAKEIASDGASLANTHFGDLPNFYRPLAYRVRQLVNCMTLPVSMTGNIVDVMFLSWDNTTDVWLRGHEVGLARDLDDSEANDVTSPVGRHLAADALCHFNQRFPELAPRDWREVNLKTASSELATALSLLAKSGAFKPCPECKVCSMLGLVR